MKWRSVQRDEPPADGQEVLLSAEGVYYCTRFDAAKQIFRLRDQPDSYFAVADNHNYYWVEIDSPPDIMTADTKQVPFNQN
jgi:hypothetical protein